MKKALIDPNGNLAQVEITDFPVAAPFHWIDVADDVTPETHDYNGTAVVLKPARPLADVKAAKIAQLEAARDAETLKDVTALGTQWQADERSQKLLGDAITLATAGLPLPAVWRDLYNNDLAITALSQLLAIAGAMAVQTQTAYAKSWTLKVQVNAAVDAAAVDAVVW